MEDLSEARVDLDASNTGVTIIYTCKISDKQVPLIEISDGVTYVLNPINGKPVICFAIGKQYQIRYPLPNGEVLTYTYTDKAEWSDEKGNVVFVKMAFSVSEKWGISPRARDDVNFCCERVVVDDSDDASGIAPVPRKRTITKKLTTITGADTTKFFLHGSEFCIVHQLGSVEFFHPRLSDLSDTTCRVMVINSIFWDITPPYFDRPLRYEHVFCPRNPCQRWFRDGQQEFMIGSLHVSRDGVCQNDSPFTTQASSELSKKVPFCNICCMKPIDGKMNCSNCINKEDTPGICKPCASRLLHTRDEPGGSSRCPYCRERVTKLVTMEQLFDMRRRLTW